MSVINEEVAPVVEEVAEEAQPEQSPGIVEDLLQQQEGEQGDQPSAHITIWIS